MRTRSGGYREGNRINAGHPTERRRRPSPPRPRGAAACGVVIAAGLALLAVAARSAPPAAGAPRPATIRVLVASGPAVYASCEAPAGGTLADDAGKALLSLRTGDEVVFQPRGDGVSATVSGRAFHAASFDLVPAAASPDGPARVRLGPVAYRGFLRVVPDSTGEARAAGSLLAINVLSVEEYLYGVVSREMPAGWPEEALKAQAVACRSFALSCARAASARGALYDIAASSDGQVYEGSGRENAAAIGAVDSTSGVVLTYGGEPIRAVYHSSSGGHTENSECVWSTPLPYLRGVPDVEDGSPHSSWEFAATAADVERLLREAGVDVGALKGITCVDSGVSGRWNRVAVTGATGSVVLRGLEFRMALGLKSTLFTLSVGDPAVEEALVRRSPAGTMHVIGADGRVRAAPSQRGGLEVHVLCSRFVPGLYVFRGRGWGHGVGMSQWGARALAERGYKHPDILKTYYLGATLEEYAG